MSILKKNLSWIIRTKELKKTIVEDDFIQRRKRNTFFDLTYWKSNLLRHNLYVMHTEKNVCDNVMYTLIGDSKKSKENPHDRKDLREMGIR